MMHNACRSVFWRACVLALCAFALPVSAADSLIWNTNKDQVTADIRSLELPALLKQVAAKTGWRVFIEPNTHHDVSAKFKQVPPAEALRFLLGDINFALVPGTNSAPSLFVFRTSQEQATQQIRPVATEHKRVE